MVTLRCNYVPILSTRIAKKIEIMSDMRKPGPKFPPTRFLEACYGDIVPNEYVSNEAVEILDNLLYGESKDF